MSLIENIRQKPQKEKIKLIWIICLSSAGLMLILWIATSRIGKNMPKDTSLFKLIKQNLHNLK
jgi:predicted permease